jgi:hypothetical protein
MNQRWRSHRTLYRPAAEVIRTVEYDVAAIDNKCEAKAFVLAHHAFGTYPAARLRFGLYHRHELVGVAVFSHPCNDLVLTRVFRCHPVLAVELGRFVQLDSVPGNGETWFLGQCYAQLRSFDLVGVLTFSDPVPRRNVESQIVVSGHLGTIFQAHNGVYLGRGTARTLRLLPDGRVPQRACDPKDPVRGARLEICGCRARTLRRAASRKGSSQLAGRVAAATHTTSEASQ